ncbi:UNKNOWN [Stylonychia lemnae]|uniref:Uncharacterized protein n=1 Tax=Stylonychia lemnae TaxID=5949 RepID=A0A078A0J8_STYLE|nr:UNKNOWN [Stylonychia lemnae]|eukprot:CDW75726.1 UNKNOWN [Stylonychia lemnae]
MPSQYTNNRVTALNNKQTFINIVESTYERASISLFNPTTRSDGSIIDYDISTKVKQKLMSQMDATGSKYKFHTY